MNEQREAAKEAVRQIKEDQHSKWKKIISASDQILELSSQMHLTWEEFEKAVELVKRYGHICT